MKILHLADLHLGKILQEQSLIEDQEYMLKENYKYNKGRKSTSFINIWRCIR